MWVARDKNNVLKLFVCKPTRIDNEWYFDGGFLKLFGYIADKFDSLRWEDEPVEVNLTLVEPFHFKLTEEAKQVVEKNTGYSTDEIKNMRIFKNPQVARIYNQFAYKDKQD